MNIKKALGVLVILTVAFLVLLGGYYFNNKINRSIEHDSESGIDFDIGNEDVVAGNEEEKKRGGEEGDEALTEGDGEFVFKKDIEIDEEEVVDYAPEENSIDVRQQMLEELRRKAEESASQETEISREEIMQKMLEEVVLKAETEEAEDTSTADRMSVLEAMRKEIEDRALIGESE